jgi:Lactate racemase N-terminal domain
MRDDLPRMMAVRQQFLTTPPVDILASVASAFVTGLAGRISPGSRIAVAVGSRGITNLLPIVRCLIDQLKQAGCAPFVVPAMGSHGGATAEGQASVLAGYGITEEALATPITASMDVELIGEAADGLQVFFSAEALRADGIIVVNRIKPHTFEGRIGSGLMKMMVIGLGMKVGAQTCHGMASRAGHEKVIRSAADVVLRTTPILGGLAIVEDQLHQTALIEFVPRECLVSREEELLVRAKELMPALPFRDIDLLIVDQIGKNISGVGMDPNITGRDVQGYSSSLHSQAKQGPTIRRIFVRDLTPETYGNAIGIGLADLTTSRLVRKINQQATYANALTSLTPHTAKIPMHFESDREAIEQALASLALPAIRQAKVVRISNTLLLENVTVSYAFADLLGSRRDLCPAGQWEQMQFDQAGDLLPLSHRHSVNRTLS